MQSTLQKTSKQILSDYKAKIDNALEEYFDSSIATAGMTLKGPETQAFTLLKEFSRRPGKRMRGAMALYFYDYFSGGKQNVSAINLGVAVELLQNYLLIIDDVMDSSATRRGGLSIHKLLEKEPGMSANLASMLAIDIGLLAQHMAALLIAQIDEKPEHINYAMQLLNQNMIATAFGQYDDLSINLNKPNEDDLIRTHQLKSSYYTFVNPLQCGAALAGVNSLKSINGLAEIGLPAGVAFQLKDDVLGLFGDQKVTGKPVVDDLKQGKYTLLMLYTFKLASTKDVAFVKTVLGKQDISPAEHRKVVEIVEKCGAKQLAEDKAQSYCEKSHMQIKLSSFLDDSAKRFLTDIINYSVNREA